MIIIPFCHHLTLNVSFLCSLVHLLSTHEIGGEPGIVIEHNLISHILQDITGQILQTRIRIQTQTLTQTQLVWSQVPLANQAVLVNPADQDLRDLQDLWAQRALKATLDRKVPLARVAQRVQEENQGIQESKEIREIQDQRDPKAHQATTETMASEESQVVRANQALQDPRDHQDSVTAGLASTAHTVDKGPADELMQPTLLWKTF